jgi:hypothetical protein
MPKFLAPKFTQILIFGLQTDLLATLVQAANW